MAVDRPARSRRHPITVPVSLPGVLAVVLGAGFVGLLVAVCLTGGRPFTADRALLTVITTRRPAGLTWAAAAVTTLGAPWTLVGVAVVALGWMVRQGRDRARLLVMAGTWAGTAGLVTIVKVLVARERPPVSALLGTPALDYSFPSGHTTDSAVVYVLVAAGVGVGGHLWRRRLLVVVASVLAVAVAASRIYLGYHWLSDVVGGWLLAGSLLTASLPALRRLDPAVASAASLRRPRQLRTAAREHPAVPVSRSR